MNIQGLNKVTLLDFPGKVACTVFTGGCDFRCPFCHNSQLVLRPAASPTDAEAFFSFLKKRKGILDGVAVTGGEPLLQPDIAGFLTRVKEMGFAVKIDTNGNHPEALAKLLGSGLCDFVAMDVKNSPGRYPETVGIPGFDISNVLRSISLLSSSDVDHEFRTTAVREFHDIDSFRGIASMIEGAPRYFVQNFVDSGAVLSSGLHGFDPGELEAFAAEVAPHVGSASVRGV